MFNKYTLNDYQHAWQEDPINFFNWKTEVNAINALIELPLSFWDDKKPIPQTIWNSVFNSELQPFKLWDKLIQLNVFSGESTLYNALQHIILDKLKIKDDVLKYLLTDRSIKSKQNNIDTLEMIISLKDDVFLTYVLKKYPEIIHFQKESNGDNLLHLAVRNKWSKGITILHEQLSSSFANSNGLTPLELAKELDVKYIIKQEFAPKIKKEKKEQCAPKIDQFSLF